MISMPGMPEFPAFVRPRKPCPSTITPPLTFFATLFVFKQLTLAKPTLEVHLNRHTYLIHLELGYRTSTTGRSSLIILREPGNTLSRTWSPSDDAGLERVCNRILVDTVSQFLRPKQIPKHFAAPSNLKFITVGEPCPQWLLLSPRISVSNLFVSKVSHSIQFFILICTGDIDDHLRVAASMIIFCVLRLRLVTS